MVVRIMEQAATSVFYAADIESYTHLLPVEIKFALNDLYNGGFLAYAHHCPGLYKLSSYTSVMRRCPPAYRVLLEQYIERAGGGQIIRVVHRSVQLRKALKSRRRTRGNVRQKKI